MCTLLCYPVNVIMGHIHISIRISFFLLLFQNLLPHCFENNCFFHKLNCLNTPKSGLSVPLHMTTFSYFFLMFRHFDPTTGVMGVCKGKIYASMVLYAPFLLHVIWYATWILSETRIPRIGCVAWQNRSQTRWICKIYIPGEGLFRETFNSKNINPISPTPKFNFGIIQTKVKSLPTSFQCLIY